MRIGLDIDDVVADFSNHYLNYLGFEDKSPATDWEDERFVTRFHEIENDMEFWMTMPTLVSPKDLHFNPVIYVTARCIPTEITERWLDLKGFPPAKVVTVGHNGSKVDALKGKVDVFIDDAFHNYLQLNTSGVKCLLMNRPHNEKYTYVNKRITNVNQALNYV